MGNNRRVINLYTPRIEGNKIFFSWEKSPIFEESSYWVEYKDLKKLDCSPEALLEAYLPICLALSFLGEVSIKLPGYVSPVVLETWKKTCRDTTRVLCKKATGVEFIVSDAPREGPAKNQNFPETALLFGGGSESLLTLAHLLDRKISPYLASLWGPGWIGSDLDSNPERYDLEEALCKEFSLKMIRINTNARTIFHKKNFKPYLRQKLFLMDAAFMLPLNISLLLPLAGQLKIGAIYSGNEKEASYGITCYSFSPEMTENLHSPGKQVSYYSDLENLPKTKVIKELNQKYPSLARYQYSCFEAKNERWCLKCEKCFRNYLIFKIFDIDPASVGIDEVRLLSNLSNIINETKKYCRKIWVLFMEWNQIREEAIRQNKKEIANMINSFCRQSLRKRFFPKTYEKTIFSSQRDENSLCVR